MKHTAGNWQPDGPPIYFAAYLHKVPRATYPPWVLVPADTIADAGDLLEEFLANGPVLMDSGIYNLTMDHARNHGVHMNDALALHPAQIDGFSRLRARYIQFARAYGDRLWGYVELDQGGAAAKRETRSELEALGLRPIPVYHPLNDGWDYFDELAAEYDRICLGNIVKANRHDRLRILATIWERRRAYPGLKWIHGLGLTVNEHMHAYPLESADSSTWYAPLRYGQPLTATADMQVVGRLDSTSAYRLGEQEQWLASNRMGALFMMELNRQWHRHISETPIPRYPPRDPREPSPCRAR